MALNARQERFCQLLATGMAQSAAYKEAGYTAGGHAAEANAERLLRKDEVRARVAALLEEGNKRLQITADDIAREAWSIATGGKVEVARVSALTLLSKRHAEFNPKFEVEHTGSVSLVRQTRSLRGH